MKLTFVAPVVTQNGGSRVIAIYADKLVRMGHDVTVVSRQPQSTSLARKTLKGLRKEKKPADDPNRTAYFDSLGDRHVQIPWKWPLEASDVPDADVIIATWWRTAFEVAALPPEKGAKAYFVQHHEIHDNQPWDLSMGSYWLPLSKITIADWLVETMATRYNDPGVPKVENSVDTGLFNAPPRARNTVPTVGLLYATPHFKGIDIAVKAIERAKQTFPDLRVIAFGANPVSSKLPLPEGAAFHHLPEQEKIRDIYASCDVWLFSSRSEGFGLPLLEAMACRTPVVATRAGAAPDLLEDGQAGYCVDVDDWGALGQRLTDVLSLSPEAWRDMSDAAYERACSYTWDDAATLFETELSRIADRR